MSHAEQFANEICTRLALSRVFFDVNAMFTDKLERRERRESNSLLRCACGYVVITNSTGFVWSVVP